MTEMIEVSDDKGSCLLVEKPTYSRLTAIRLTLQFYNSHLMSQPKPRGSSHPQLILLTDDRANRAKAQDMGLSATSARDYVNGLPDELKVKLIDLVATGSGDGHAPSGDATKRIYADVSRQEPDPYRGCLRMFSPFL